MRTTAGSLLVASILLTANASATDAGWLADFDKALDLAREQGKDLLVDFTGSDW